MRMTGFRLLGGVVLCVLLASGCLQQEEEDKRDRWIELGQVPAARNTGASNHSPMAVSNGKVFIGTNDGVWTRPLSAGTWSRSGLNGMKVQEILAHPTRNGVLFAAGEYSSGTQVPMARSTDGGMTWTNAATSVFNSFENMYYVFYDLEARPGHPDTLYANMSGNVINVSIDGGANWHLQQGYAEPGFNYPCVIHVPATDNAHVYQGCEAPLDFAWIARQTISANDAANLSGFEYLVYQDTSGDLLIENRRPNALTSAKSSPLALYAGIEGGLLKIEADGDFKWLMRQTQAHTEYAYVSAIWVDPADAKHIIFGGFDKGPAPADFTLYETFDEGKAITRIQSPRRFTFPWIEQIVDTGEDLLVAISDNTDQDSSTLDPLYVFRLAY